MMSTGALDQRHRTGVADILRSTGAFSDQETVVALELFDAAFPIDGSAGDRDYEFVGAFGEGDDLSGYACYGPTPGTVGTFDLYWIAVDATRHGDGAGSMLLADVERELQARDARLLVVETSSRSDYAAARGFYARRGYSETARVREFYAPSDDRVIFTKRLRASPDAGPGAAVP